MAKIGIFYGPEKGSVESVAHKLSLLFLPGEVELKSVKTSNKDHIQEFDYVILGLSTVGSPGWDSSYQVTDWDVFMPELDKVNWQGKKVAIFGLGDQVQYPDHFVDAIAWIYNRIKPLGAQVVGFCSLDGYDFNESEAVLDGQFIGLPIDEDSEPEKTDERLSKWVEKVKSDFGL